MTYETKCPSVGLWASNSDRGPMASGNSGGIRFVLWRNDKRGNDRAPDYRLVLEAPQKRDDAGQGQDTRSREPASSGAPAGGYDDGGDSIPFAPW